MSDPELIQRSEPIISPGEPPLPDATEPSFVQRLFKGPGGIRAGWRVALYVAMALGIAVTLLFILQPAHVHGAARLWLQFAQEAVLVVSVIIPAFVLARLENRSFDDYGLPRSKAFGMPFWAGCLWGVLAITVLLGGIRGLHGFSFGQLALHGVRIIKFGFFWGLYFLLVAFFEEFSFRGYMQFTLTAGIGFWPAAVVLSAAFGAIHRFNPGESWVGVLSAGLIGFFFCLTLRRTGSLWFAVGFHQAFDWGETFLYSVPDSGTVEPGHLLSSSFHGPIWLTGGSVGPEGSALLFILIAVIWVIFDRIYPESKYVVSSPSPGTV